MKATIQEVTFSKEWESKYGTMKSVDFKLLEFAKEKFGKTTDEILNA